MPLWVQALLAIHPILVAAVLLGGFRLPARVAMPVVYVLAVLIGGIAWMMPPAQIVAASIQGLFIAFEILFIIFAADPAAEHAQALRCDRCDPGGVHDHHAGTGASRW